MIFLSWFNWIQILFFPFFQSFELFTDDNFDIQSEDNFSGEYARLRDQCSEAKVKITIITALEFWTSMLASKNLICYNWFFFSLSLMVLMLAIFLKVDSVTAGSSQHYDL